MKVGNTPCGIGIPQDLLGHGQKCHDQCGHSAKSIETPVCGVGGPCTSNLTHKSPSPFYHGG